MTTTPQDPEEPPPGSRLDRPSGSVPVGRHRTPRRETDPAARTGTRAAKRGWYALLLVPFVALLWLPFYARRTPELFGFPFFYWYQFAWVFLGAAITGLVYLLTTSSDAPPPSGEPGGGGRPTGAHRRPGGP